MWKLGRFFLYFFVFGWFVFSFVFAPFTTHATITSLISYQAKLTDTNNVAITDAAYTIKFRIYAASSGGTALYAEQQSVTTTNGFFSALIGSGTLIESSGALSSVDFNQDPLYLGVQVGSDSEMTPRKRIAASVFAFNANRVGGKSETEFALLAGRAGGQTLSGGNAASENLTLQSTASSTKGKIFFGANSAYDDANSRFGVGTSTPGSRLVVQGSDNTSSNSSLNVTNASTTSLLFVRNDGTIGIGLTNPADAFHVARENQTAGITVQAFGTGSNDYGSLTISRARGTIASPTAVQSGNALGRMNFSGYDGSGNNAGGTIEGLATENWSATARGTSLKFFTTNVGTSTNSERMIITDSGNVGVGTSAPGARFDVYNATSTTNLDIVRVLSDVGGTGNIKFRIDSDGDIFTDGSTTIGTPADFAENYIGISDTLRAGDIVSLSGETLGVDKSGVTYDKKMLGVISERPGIILAGDLERGVPVALSGRVPVRVSLENGPIYVGDPITSSNVPGVGMKATKTGKIVGYALEDYIEAKDHNTILVFVNLGYHLADDAFGRVSLSEAGMGTNFVSSVKQTLAMFTGIVKTAGTWIFDTIETTFLGVKHLTVENGITIKDKVTGEYYCMTVQNGVVVSEKGMCDTSEPSVSMEGVANSSPVVSSETSSSPGVVLEIASSTPLIDSASSSQATPEQ